MPWAARKRRQFRLKDDQYAFPFRAFEIVAIARGENLEIYLDRFATNEPVIGATLEVESPGGPVKAAAGADGTYRVAAPWLAKGGRTDLIFTVTAGDTTDILPLTIQAASGAAQNAAPRDSTWCRPRAWR